MEYQFYSWFVPSGNLAFEKEETKKLSDIETFAKYKTNVKKCYSEVINIRFYTRILLKDKLCLFIVFYPHRG